MSRREQETLYGIGQGLVDLRIDISPEHLRDLQVDAGSSLLVDHGQHSEILQHLRSSGRSLIMNPGGSVANSLATVASLGGRATFSARIGDDPAGAILCHDFASVGVKLGTPLVVGGTTGSVIVLTTPDGERTMLAHLGTSAELTHADINIPMLRQA